MHQLHISFQQLVRHATPHFAFGLFVGVGFDQRQMVDAIRQKAGQLTDFAIHLGGAALHLPPHDQRVHIFQRQHRETGHRKDPVVFADPPQRHHHIIYIGNQIKDDIDKIGHRAAGIVDDGAHQIRGIVLVKILHPHAQHLVPQRLARPFHTVRLCLHLTGNHQRRQHAKHHIKHNGFCQRR